ncbi:MAG TPA: xanthine dehydrogenase small subunit, partial [Bacteroidales bacterium]|nr:xanthine dehydrogenase small subunit [Bacteroidales bacterium]
MTRHTIRFILDDHPVEIDFSGNHGLGPTTTVLNYLRSLPGHKGVKEGCAEGDCGACTVVLAEPGRNGKLAYRVVDSCLVFLPMIHGKQLITIENLAITHGNEKKLHPVQQMMAERNGSQCGYCTPGMVMSMFGLFKNHMNPTRETIEDALAGNLCRCTGYQPILDAAQTMGRETQDDHFSRDEHTVLALLNEIGVDHSTIEIKTAHQSYFKPFTLGKALRLRKENPGATLISGSTDVSLRQTKNHEFLPLIIDLSAVEELRFAKEETGRYIIGAGLPLEEVKSFAEGRLPALYKTLKVFGSLQIRNIATLGGNAGSASPIGDTLPLLMAYRAKIGVRSMNAHRIVGMEEFITGYRKTDIHPDELITDIIIPKTIPGTRVESFKVSRRKDLDISTVSAAFRLNISEGKVADIILAFGGMAAVPKRALQTEQFLTGKPWTSETISGGIDILGREFSPISDARAETLYRQRICGNLLMKFFVDAPAPPVSVAVPASVADPFRGMDQSAEKHVTGESVFIGDIPVNDQLLFGKVVFSRNAHAGIKQIDISRALKIAGVHSILTAKEIPGENQLGHVVHDEPCLAGNEVTFIGQAIALIAAESEEAALAAEKQIIIEYEPLPAILEIEAAMAAGNLIARPHKIERGDPDGKLKKAPHIIRGELRTGAQEHWYLETQAALAIPGEGREMMIHASSQNPSETQATVAGVLGIAKNEVEVEVRRIGGAFGGKETQGNHVAAWAALLARATNRPVRIQLPRDDDQVMTGK